MGEIRVTKTKIDDLLILEPQVFGDSRGWFMESWSRKDFQAAGLDVNFVQDNHSYSSQKNILRGIHFQKGIHSQAKLVRCIRGAVLDVAVDLRKGSPWYLEWVAVELSEENRQQLFIPKGFGHGFLSRTEDVEFCYKTDQYYNGEADRSIRYNDPQIGVKWGTDQPILSDKDRDAPLLADSDADFVYMEI